MKEFTVVFTCEVTIIGKMPEECSKNPADFPKEKYEEALKKGVLTAKDFDDLKVTKMQVFDTTRQKEAVSVIDLADSKSRQYYAPEIDCIGLTD